ncbi:MAG: lysylphosphatidylglycerol synthase transmembrane domain-containing protein, partial [Flavobacteriaceae bacterium]|nr:lysylphosphatidylglycerol synthase transmembrane domain-containing protein [Flavobacteriaceae bacterium]
MKKKLIQSLKIILPIAVGVFFIWLQLSNISTEDQNILWQQIKEANYIWLALGIIISFISHLSRAWRWNYMLEPLGFKPKFATNIAAIGIGYVLNLAIPRSGEISRAAVIAKTDGISFEKSFGTIISERLADLVILAALMLLAFLLQFDVLTELFVTHFSGQKLFLITGIGFGLALLLFLFIKFGSGFLQQKLKAFLLNLRDGITSIFKMKQYKAFIYHTIFIWFLYVLMFY